MLKEFLASNIGRIVLIAVVIAIAGGIIASILNEGVANAVEQISSEVVKQYPEAPYTAAALPAPLTDAFANLRAVPGSWNTQGTCNTGSRATPSGGCWTLVVDAAGLLNFIVPGNSQADCLSIAKAVRPDVLRRLTMASVNEDGANSTANALNLSTVLPQLRGAALNDLAAANCQNTTTNQWALIFR